MSALSRLTVLLINKSAARGIHMSTLVGRIAAAKDITTSDLVNWDLLFSVRGVDHIHITCPLLDLRKGQ